MTAPKRHLPGQVARLTRRTKRDMALLRPGRRARHLVGYMFCRAALEHDIQPCAASCLHNRVMSVSVDRRGQRSKFMQQFHSDTAKKRNVQIGNEENVWAIGEPGDAVCLDLEAIVEDMLDTFLQPVAAGLVDTCDEWTGFHILPKHWGKPIRFERPPECKDPLAPPYIELTPMPPPGFEDLPLDEVIAFFEKLIREREADYRKRRKVDPLGIAYCEAMGHFRSPRKLGDRRDPATQPNPRFSCQNEKQLAAALTREKQFHQEHMRLLNEFRDGNRAVIFPSGTIHMARRAGVNVAAMPPDDPHRSCWEWTDGLQQQWASR